MKLAALGKRYTLWVGFVAVLVPLAVLLAFQYRWLRELDSFSERAQKAQVESLLEAVSKNVEYFYTDAGQVLDLPARHLHPEPARPRGPPVQEEGGGGGQAAVRDGACATATSRSTSPPPAPPSTSRTRRPRRGRSRSPSPPGRRSTTRTASSSGSGCSSRRRTPTIRILLYPVTDDASRLVGLAGMVLDEDYFRARVLPAAIRDALADFGDSDRRTSRSSRSRTARGGSSTPPARSRGTPPGTPRPGGRSASSSPTGTSSLASRHATAGRGGAAELPGQHGPVGGARRRAPRRPHARPAHRLARDEAVADEERVRLQRLPRAAHAARLHPRLRRVPPPRALRQPGEGPRVRRLHRDREPPPDPADQQHPRLRQHRVRPQDLPLRALRRRARSSAQTPEDLRGAAAAERLQHPSRGRRHPPAAGAHRRRRRSPSRSRNLLDNAVKYSRGGDGHRRRAAARGGLHRHLRRATRGSASRATSSARSSTASTA